MVFFFGGQGSSSFLIFRFRFLKAVVPLSLPSECWKWGYEDIIIISITFLLSFSPFLPSLFSILSPPPSTPPLAPGRGCCAAGQAGLN